MTSSTKSSSYSVAGSTQGQDASVSDRAAPGSKDDAAIFETILSGILRIVPTAMFGGLGALAVGFVTKAVDSSQPGVIIADRFFQGAYFYLAEKFCLLVVLPLVSGYHPGRILNAGISGAGLGYYFGSYGSEPYPVGSSITTGLIAMLFAAMGGGS